MYFGNREKTASQFHPLAVAVACKHWGAEHEVPRSVFALDPLNLIKYVVFKRANVCSFPHEHINAAKPGDQTRDAAVSEIAAVENNGSAIGDQIHRSRGGFLHSPPCPHWAADHSDADKHERNPE